MRLVHGEFGVLVETKAGKLPRESSCTICELKRIDSDSPLVIFTRVVVDGSKVQIQVHNKYSKPFSHCSKF